MTTTNITSGTDFIGKTLIIGSTALPANKDWSKVVEFNNNTTDTYLGVIFSAVNKQPWFTFRPLGQDISDPIMYWTAYSNVYYIYVFSFVSDIQVKYNIYEYNGASTIISKGTIGTYTAASAFLQNLTQFWLGRTIWGDDFYSGTYNKVALYNSDLLALSEANILSTLLTLVTSTHTNIINNSTTYTFRALGTNFLGVVVNILNYNTTTGSNVTTSAITLNESGSNITSGGYLNIIGSYIETIPNAPAPTSELGSIYATTISSEKYIVIASQNIELSGNVIIKNDATLSSGLINSNSIVPNDTNSASLGSPSKIWSNAYINDLSINNNIEISGNTIINGILQVSNIYTKSEVDNSFSNVYTKTEIDASFLKIDASLANVYTKNQVYSKTEIDISFVSKQLFDVSINALAVSGAGSSIVLTSISGNIIPSTNNTYNLGSTTQFWKNAYINDICGGNIYSKTEVDSSLLTVLNTSHYTKQYGNNIWNQIGQDISFSNSIVFNGISNNGRVIALTEPAYASNRGRLYVYEISFNGTTYSWQTLGLSSEIMVGQTTNTLFGGDGNSIISLSSDGRVVAVSETLNDTSGTDTGQVRVFELSANVWIQRGQLINGKPIVNYKLGYNIALSGNGNILALSSRLNNGELLVYELSANTNSWIKMGQDISGLNGSGLGFSMSLSLDGTTLAAGYRSATPPLVEIYRFNSGSRTWSLPIGSTINGTTIDQYFGWNIKLSSDGNTIVVGGIGYGTSAGNTINGIGSVSVFKYNGIIWSQLGQTLYGASANDLFGQWVQISNDGTIISAAGSISYVRVYKLYLNTWIQIGQVLNGTGIAPNLGTSMNALSGDGTTLVQIINKSVGNTSRVYGMDKLLTFDALFASSLTINNNIVPFVNNTSSLGTSAIRWSNVFTTNLNVTGTFTNTSDDRLKHNEVTIANGLDVIDKLNPQFYQKTQVMLDASYNGDLSAHSWSYEAGLIAQDLLQINDLSFVVSGGDYYRESYIYKRQTYDPSNTYYDPSNTNYDISNANYDISNTNYDICYNLITQTYNVNYNSIFVYGLAAIKELHAKVKAQETTISSLITRIELLEQQKV